jgi:hypothetical protein
MFWHLLKGAAAYAHWEYDSVCLGELDQTKEVGKLDEIDPKIVGKANLEKVKETGFAFAVRAVLLLCSITHFLAEVEPPDDCRTLKTDAKWAEHLTQLEAFQLLKEIDRDEVRNTATYFAVPKSDGQFMRAIFNGRKFSMRCRRPPSTNLPDITQVLRALADFVSTNKGNVHFVTSDI